MIVKYRGADMLRLVFKTVHHAALVVRVIYLYRAACALERTVASPSDVFHVPQLTLIATNCLDKLPAYRVSE